MTFVIDKVRPTELTLHNLTCGVDGRLWCSTLNDSTILSLDPETGNVANRFDDEAFCTFICNGRLGVIGTMDGRVLSFDVENPTIYTLARMEHGGAVGPIDIDEQSESVFFVCQNFIYRISFDGDILGHWRCQVAPFTIRYNPRDDEIWSACDGIQRISIGTGESVVRGKEGNCPYVKIAVSRDGRIACFGGNIDIFASWEELILTVPGGFNGGLFNASGRLLAREVTKEFPEGIRSSTRCHAGFEYDVISTCNSFVLCPDDSLIVSHRGKLFYLSRR